jgi:hypothetical protein
VRQSDLGEYEENKRIKDTNIQDKTSTPPQPKANHKPPPQTKSYGWQTSSSELKRVITKT